MKNIIESVRCSSCALLLVVMSASMLAQGGSNYSIFGLGDIRQSTGAAYDGMGGTVYSTPSDVMINFCNPALWTDVKTTRIQGGYRFNQVSISTSTSSTANNNGKLDGASVLFALDTTAGVSACIGLMPSTSVNYIFSKPIIVPLPDSGSITGRTRYAGTGGLTSAFAGGAFEINDHLSVGIRALFHFGVITDSAETSIDRAVSNSAITVRNDHLYSTGLTVGVQAIPAADWTIGAALTYTSNLQYDSDVIYGRTDQVGADTLTLSGSSPMPFIAGLGASYRSGKFLFVADMEYQSLSKMTYRLGGPGSFDNAMRASFGVSRIGTQSAGAAYLDKVNFNFGLGLNNLPYTVNGHRIGEYYASVGAQLPFGGAAMVDMALTLGSRGTTDFQLLSEQFLRFSVTLSVGEVWFIPFKRE